MAKIEVFTAGYPLCDDAVVATRKGANPNCEVPIYYLDEPEIADKSRNYGITHVPTVVVNGHIVDCCP